jgi:undecaprenyl phosphate-alpha-L-ara4N flippase subunit ArnF
VTSQTPDTPTTTGGAVEPGTMLILLTSIALATTGQLLLKAGMADAGAVVELDPGTLLGLLGTIVTSWKLLAGLAAFGLSALFWLVALSRIPLSTAYPVVSLSYVLILGFSTIVLNERPSWMVWIGALLIMGGISMVGLGQR